MHSTSSPRRIEESGPVVVHVEIPDLLRHEETTTNMLVRPPPPSSSSSQRPQQRGRKLYVVIGCLLALASIKIILEGSDLVSSDLVSRVPKSKLLPGNKNHYHSYHDNNNKSNKKPMLSFGMFDVDAPPPGQAKERRTVSEGILNWGQHHHSREKENKDKKKKNKATTPKGKTVKYDLSEHNDDEIPHAAAGVVQTAAEALLCPDSVVAFVDNATDLKDECDGLKKAFSKHCADNDTGEEKLQERRRLSEADDIILVNDETKNPVIKWQIYIRDLLQQASAPHVHRRLSETKIEKTEAKSHPKKDETKNTEKKEEEVKHDKKEKYDAEDEVPPSPKKDGSVKNKSRISRMSLDLPIKGHHLSQKALSETLLLHKDDKAVMASLLAAQNATNTTAAKESAAASLKVLSDTADLVSSVLNDPSSVEARTCCTSMLDVFHEICSVDEEEELSDKQLFLVVAVITLCGLVKSLIRHFQIRWLPEAAGCVLVGVLAGWCLQFYPHHDFSFDGRWFLRVMVPPIIFEAALSINKRSFNRHIVPILLFSSIGTLLATVVTAVFVHRVSEYLQCTTIPITEAMTFGALISSIDPIAVLSVLSNMGMTDTDTIYVLIFGESLLNDGVAIVLFETLLHFLDDDMQGDFYAVMAAGIHFLVVAIGSLLVGIASGICCTVYYWLMHGCQTPLVEILTFCCWALLPYYICDGIEWSGIVAVVATGFVMDMYVVGQHGVVENKEEEEVPRRRRVRAIFAKEGHLSPEAKVHIGFVTEIIATMMETAIFAYLGLFLFSSRYHWNFSHALVAIAGCLLGRAIMIPSLSVVANWITRSQQVRADCFGHQLPVSDYGEPKSAAGVVIDKKMQLVLWFAGLRGAMSFALVENIPLYDPVTGEGTGLKAELKAMTSACILFTVFVLGGLTFYMMEGLGMAPNSGGSGGIAKGNSEEMKGLLQKQSEEDGDIELKLSASTEYCDKKLTPPRTKFRQRIGH